MSTLDLILLLVLGLGAFKGYQQGLVVEIFSFLAFFLGLFIALELTIPVSLRLFGSSDFFDLGAIGIFIALFMLLSVSIRALAKGLKKMIDFTFFGTLDNVFGALAGLFKWAFIISIVFWVFDSVGMDMTGRYTDDTAIFPYIVGIGPKVFEWISGILPIVRDLIDSMETLPKDPDAIYTFWSGEIGNTNLYA